MGRVKLLQLLFCNYGKEQTDGREKGSAENGCFSTEYCEGRGTGIVPCH